MKYCVFDTETTLRNTGDEAVGSFAASPYCKDNVAVYFGYKADTHKKPVIMDMRTGEQPPFFTEAKYLVGQNIRFDLAYLRKHWPDEYLAWLRNGGRIWDTQTVEYLLTAQQSKMVSLDDLVIKYGGTLKDSRVSEFWEAGVDTADIPEEIIIPYLEGDVTNTEIVFLNQLRIARELGMVPLILSQMDAMLATAEMQWNGMHFDRTTALDEASKLKKKVDDIRTAMIEVMRVVAPELPEPNPMSNDHNSLVLFGGSLAVREQHTIFLENGEPARFKSGQRAGEIRTKYIDVPYKVTGFACKPQDEWATAKTGIYQVNDQVLSSIKTRDARCKEYIANLLELRAIEKDLGTYFIGLSDLCWHDSKIRAEHNHCVTVTGRLSSSKPNLQNISNKERDE